MREQENVFNEVSCLMGNIMGVIFLVQQVAAKICPKRNALHVSQKSEWNGFAMPARMSTHQFDDSHWPLSTASPTINKQSCYPGIRRIEK